LWLQIRPKWTQGSLHLVALQSHRCPLLQGGRVKPSVCDQAVYTVTIMPVLEPSLRCVALVDRAASHSIVLHASGCQFLFSGPCEYIWLPATANDDMCHVLPDCRARFFVESATLWTRNCSSSSFCSCRVAAHMHVAMIRCVHCLPDTVRDCVLANVANGWPSPRRSSSSFPCVTGI